MGSIIMATTIGDQGRQRWLRRNRGVARNGARSNTPATQPTPLRSPARRQPAERIDSRKEHVLFGAAVLTFISLLLAVVAFKLPLTRSIVEDIAYTQAGTFSY